MKLQLAIDELNLEQALEQLESIVQYIDIIEIGTPMLIDEGRKAVKAIKETYPHKEVLCDAKIMDAGAYEAQLAYDVGADFVTVLGVTDNITIEGCVSQAQKQKRQVVVDMIMIEDFEKRVPELEQLNVDVIAVHTGADQQSKGRTPIDDLKSLQKYATRAKIAVAGGINSKTVNDYISLKPDVIIVGSGILNADDPVLEARLIASEIQKYNEAK